MQKRWRKIISHAENRGLVVCQVLQGNEGVAHSWATQKFWLMPLGACSAQMQCTKPGQGFDVVQQLPSPHPSKAPKNVWNSKSFHMENAVESLVAANVGVWKPSPSIFLPFYSGIRPQRCLFTVFLFLGGKTLLWCSGIWRDWKFKIWSYWCLFFLMIQN